MPLKSGLEITSRTRYMLMRHRDGNRDVLAELAKKAGGGLLGGLGAKKFGGLDIKRVSYQA